VRFQATRNNPGAATAKQQLSGSRVRNGESRAHPPFMKRCSITEQLAGSALWPVDPEKWRIYRQVLKMAQRRSIPFAVGGGTATMLYTGRPRQSKDIDLFLAPEHREEMVQVTRECGLVDLYDEQPYDRAWIYRAHDGAAIVDVIWSMANYRTRVDATWLEKGPEIEMDGLRIRVVPAEETLWCKLYILQRDRCDWPDALNLLNTVGPDLDWQRVISRLGADTPLLSGLLSVFAWLCPDRARDLPRSLWHRLKLEYPAPLIDARARARVNRLDSRPWFGPEMPEMPGPAGVGPAINARGEVYKC
jgi:predicted nucleotidyltransferase